MMMMSGGFPGWGVRRFSVGVSGSACPEWVRGYLAGNGGEANGR
jgi:hypothetical protein